MADGGTITQRITDLIGSEHTTTAAYSGDLINAAINEIADMLSDNLLLKYSPAPLSYTSGSGQSVTNKKVLQVTRVDADSSGIERVCREVDRDGWSKGRDTNSIYLATNFSPICHVDVDGVAGNLLIFPLCNASGQTGNVWYFPYIADGTDTTAMTAALLESSYYLPSQLIHAVALKASMNILLAYISEQVQEEEDIEIMQMIQNQLQLLEKSFITEMQRYTSKDDSGGE